MPFLSPLRYPGGKRRLAGFVQRVFELNNIVGECYVEPFAGGAAVALALLFSGHTAHIYINDVDRGIYTFWRSVLDDTEHLCRLVYDTDVTMEERQKQRQIVDDPDRASALALGFATLFLNRTNRSGIIRGGVIGGKDQQGKWNVASRFTKPEIVRRIQAIAQRRSQISLYGLEAQLFLTIVQPDLSEKSLIFLDPPYYVKGGQNLYANYYRASDHVSLGALVQSMHGYWVVSYDDVPEIRTIYRNCRSMSYSMNYSTQSRYAGSEVMFFSPSLMVPEVATPVRLSERHPTPCKKSLPVADRPPVCERSANLTHTPVPASTRQPFDPVDSAPAAVNGEFV